MVETVLVIGLLAAMTGVYLATADLSRNALERATRKIESDLRYARHLAMTQEQNCGMWRFSPVAYQIYCQNFANIVTDPQNRTPLIVNVSTTYGATFLGGGMTTVEFGPRGTATNLINQPLRISRGNRSHTFWVSSEGVIEVQ